MNLRSKNMSAYILTEMVCISANMFADILLLLSVIFGELPTIVNGILYSDDTREFISLDYNHC